MFDDLIKAIIAKDEARACKLAQELDYISYKDIIAAVGLAAELPKVIDILNEKVSDQDNDLEFKEESEKFVKFTSLEKIPLTSENLSIFILSKFVKNEQIDIKSCEHELLDHYFVSIINIRPGQNSKNYVKSFLTTSETANNILIENIDQYIRTHPEQISYSEWIPTVLGQEAIQENYE